MNSNVIPVNTGIQSRRTRCLPKGVCVPGALDARVGGHDKGGHDKERRRSGEGKLMSVFVTGGTGFIGKRLVRRLLERDGELVHVLVYKPTPELTASLEDFWGEGAGRVTFVEGDISKPDLGVKAEDALEARRQGRPLLPPRCCLRSHSRAGAGRDRQCRRRRQRARLRKKHQGRPLPSCQLDRGGRPL